MASNVEDILSSDNLYFSLLLRVLSTSQCIICQLLLSIPS